MNEIARETITKALYAADLDEDALYEDYSGRAMYGSECLGIKGSDADGAKFLIGLAAQEPELAMEMAGNQRSDNLGRGLIIYFPGFTIAAE